MKPIKMEVDLTTTLCEVQNFIQEKKKAGCICPACSRLIKIYSRKFNKSMAATLITLYKIQRDSNEFIHIGNEFTSKQINYGNCELAKLRYWNFVEQLDKKSADEESDLDVKKGKTSGYWRLTDIGRMFVEGRITVFAEALVENKKCIGMKGDQITIRKAFKKEFDYDELMRDYSKEISMIL